jgi:hypothetical protein
VGRAGGMNLLRHKTVSFICVIFQSRLSYFSNFVSLILVKGGAQRGLLSPNDGGWNEPVAASGRLIYFRYFLASSQLLQ